jgi:hypothetical protein
MSVLAYTHFIYVFTDYVSIGSIVYVCEVYTSPLNLSFGKESGYFH